MDERPADDIDADPHDGRDETIAQRADRNWNEILQELRVTQTGTQIITGFLLTLAFQPRFAELDGAQVVVYLVLVLLAVLTTALALAPVSLHRSLFQKRAKGPLVETADRILQIVLVGVALVLSGTVLLVFDVVVGRTAGIAVGAALLVVTVGAALTLPAVARRRMGRADDRESADRDDGRMSQRRS